MNNSIKWLFILVICTKIIVCQDAITLSGIILDQTPQRNPDFEINPYTGGVFKGLVQTTLGSDETPTYCCGQSTTYNNGNVEIHNGTTFYAWFHLVPDVSMILPFDLTLVKNPSTGYYEYRNSAFFPIDGLGWDNPILYPDQIIYNNHNYHFCLEIHSSFYYKGGEFFTFTGDDDVFVYFNKQLLIDLGGVHQAASQTAQLDTQGYSVGELIPFDFFYCERHTSQSNLNVITNIDLSCDQYDACGVCYGKNNTCCLAEDYCDQPSQGGSKCTNSYCSSIDNKTCIHEVKDCDDDNACTLDLCLPRIGCVHIRRICTDSDPCTIDYCDVSDGCIHDPVENCNGCNDTTCVTVNPCYPNVCDVESGECVLTAVDCTPINPDPCINSVCNPRNGQCVLYDVCPTDTPTVTPTQSPTPNITVTNTPTRTPTTTPTRTPTTTPTRTPTTTPTRTPTHTPTRTPTTTPIHPTNPGVDCSYEETDPPRCLECPDIRCSEMGLTCILLDNPTDDRCPKTPTCTI